MIQTSEIETNHIVRTLRIYVNDLSDKFSPFNKDEKYLRDLAGWIACAASRIEKLAQEHPDAKIGMQP